MYEYSICTRLSLACFMLLSTMIGGMFMIPPAPRFMTMGVFSEAQTEHKETLYRLSNCYGYETHGQYLHFKLDSETRYDVVLKLKDPRTNDLKSGIYFGICKGLVMEKIEGCPVNPPFFLMADVVSERK